MSRYAEKIKAGQPVTDEDWNQFLHEAHRLAPGMTPAAFAPYRTADGLNSYAVLTESVAPLRGRGATVLDLACGDGHLIAYLLEALGENGKVIGVDMSEGELAIASKRYGADGRVALHRATAQALPCPDGSVDAIVCHMAFMLMLPLEPVVAEIRRVLKPGGTFSAVIGNARGKAGLLGEVQTITGRFLGEYYPKFQESRSGDPRVQSEATLNELFSALPGFRPPVRIHDFALRVKTDPHGVWDLMRDMYFVSMLPAPEKEKLKADLLAFASSRQDETGILTFDFHLRRFDVARQ